MGRGGAHRFLEQWHHRQLDLDDGDVVSWVLIDDPAHRRSHAECFRRLGRCVDPAEARRLLVEHGHSDAGHVHIDTHVGRSMSH